MTNQNRPLRRNPVEATRSAVVEAQGGTGPAVAGREAVRPSTSSRKNPYLMTCSPESFQASMLDVAFTGLSPVADPRARLPDPLQRGIPVQAQLQGPCRQLV